LQWYNEFWLPCLCIPKGVKANAGHETLHVLMERFPFTLRLITQNVDGLHATSSRTIEAHGRLGLFKCIPDVDSDTDSESDDEDDRLVHLGHRRKWRQSQTKTNKCPYQQKQSLTVDQIEPSGVRETLKEGKGPLTEPPKCPFCNNILAPQALLFDEGYHSHDFYEFQKMEDWLAEAEVIVFIGTSFAVRLPEVTLEHAKSAGIPVYNFNTHDMLEPSVTLDANNVRGAAELTLPRLLQEVEELQMKLDHPDPELARSSSSPSKPLRLRRSIRKKRPKQNN
jgi:NAD-dependent SIR2 family protein deacetylase